MWTGQPIFSGMPSAPQRPPEGPNLSVCQQSGRGSPWRYCVVGMISNNGPMSYSSRPGNIFFYNPTSGAVRLLFDDLNERPIIFQQLPGRTPVDAAPGLLVSLSPAPAGNDVPQGPNTPQSIAVVKPDGSGLKRLDIARQDFIRAFNTADEGLSFLVRDGTQVRRIVLDPTTLEMKSRDLVPPERAVEYQRIPPTPNLPPQAPFNFGSPTRF
jgi:hypothetical protein